MEKMNHYLLFSTWMFGTHALALMLNKLHNQDASV